MGSEVCRAVAVEEDLELMGAVDPAFAGKLLSEVSGVAGSVIEIAAVGDNLPFLPAVAVDFTEAAAALVNLRWCVDKGVHAVVGTTGMTPKQIASIEDALEKSGGNTGVLIAPNFAIGALLMMDFARRAAGFLPDAEIIELHHDQKKDAPSGTSLKTVEAIVSGRKSPPSETSSAEMLSSVRGGEKEGVRVHSVRLPGLYAHQEVIFGGPGQTLSIRHDSLDRRSFIPGVLMAIREIGRRPGLTVGLENLLDMGMG